MRGTAETAFCAVLEDGLGGDWTQPKTVARLPVGWRPNVLSEALYGYKVIFRSFGALVAR